MTIACGLANLVGALIGEPVEAVCERCGGTGRVRVDER